MSDEFFLKKNGIACPFVYFFLPVLGLTKENLIPYELIKLRLVEHPCFFVVVVLLLIYLVDFRDIVVLRFSTPESYDL